MKVKKMKNLRKTPVPSILLLLFLLTLTGCRDPLPEAEPVPPETVPVQTEEPEPEPPVETVAMIGDSLTERCDFSRYFETVTLYNFGISGDTISGVTERLAQAEAVSPDLLFILCGINSLFDDTLERCLAEYGILASEAAAVQGGTRIVIQSVLPASAEYMYWKPCSISTIRSFNEGIRAIAEKHGFDFLDLFGSFVLDDALDPELTVDGLHLNEKGYDIWAELLRPYIENE